MQPMTLPARSGGRRRGYTLLEMIVVLAVVASLAAITLPVLFRPLGKAELREAAKQVQAALLEVRTRAVESGVVQEFRFEPGGRRYEILSRSEDEENAVQTVTPRRGAAKTSLGPTKSAALEPLGDRLPDGIVFADLRDEMPAKPLAPLPATKLVAVEDAMTGQTWSAPLRFYANGRGVNTRLKLLDSKSWSIEILLRGLTCLALVGEPRRVESTQESLPHESWSPARIPVSR
jgi:prepilin-type N-terminal cleavage/methylation domain-containing protein